jgi:hypothetical protein
VATDEGDKKKEGKGFAGLSSLVSDVDTPPPSAAKKPTASSTSAFSGAGRPAPQAAPPKPQPAPQTPYKPPQQPGSGSSAGKWVLGIAVVIGVVWLIGQSNKTTTSPAPGYPQPAQSTAPSYTSSPNRGLPDTTNPRSLNGADSFSAGQFRCSSFDSAEADRLAPSESQSQLESDQNALDAQSAELDRLKALIDSSATDQNSTQEEINSYNELVEEYNSRLGAYKRDAASLQASLDRFNAQVNAHNAYLANHCVRASQ